MSHPDDQRLKEAYARIGALSKEKQGEAIWRFSRSYSAPSACIRFDGCWLDGDSVVWPDGERWPARSC